MTQRHPCTDHDAGYPTIDEVAQRPELHASLLRAASAGILSAALLTSCTGPTTAQTSPTDEAEKAESKTTQPGNTKKPAKPDCVMGVVSPVRDLPLIKQPEGPPPAEPAPLRGEPPAVTPAPVTLSGRPIAPKPVEPRPLPVVKNGGEVAPVLPKAIVAGGIRMPVTPEAKPDAQGDGDITNPEAKKPALPTIPDKPVVPKKEARPQLPHLPGDIIIEPAPESPAPGTT